MPQGASDQTAMTPAPAPRHRKRTLHGDLARPVLIHRPTRDEQTLLGHRVTYAEALSVLKRALDDDAAMNALRRVLDWGRAHLLSDLEVLERLAREVALGRMIITDRPARTPPKPDRYAATYDKAYRALLAGPFEGSIPYMYLDSLGYVTVGVGKMLPTPSSALLLKFVHQKGKSRATPAEITAAYMSVRASAGNRPAASYRKLTDLDLAPGEADRLLTDELQTAEDGCRTLFPAWNRFPLAAQLALLDMVYNMGPGQALTQAQRRAGQREHGLFQFHRLRASVAKEDWAAASRECERQGIQRSRNFWTRDKFLEAAHIAPPRPEPHRALNL